MDDRALAPDDGDDMRFPFGPGDRGLRVEHRNGAGFVTVAPFPVHALCARQGLGGGADGFGLLTEDGLVVLELDDQMGVGDGGGFESFFGNAWRHR